jgi:6-phosphofructokinase 2
MTGIAVRTLTLNPSIDVSSETERVRPTRKVRTANERLDAGGGGVNVARVLNRLGVGVEALFLAGGATGRVLDELLDKQGVARRPLWIADDTRMSLTVHERSTGLEYRFVPEGPEVTAGELSACLAAIEGGAGDYLVLSGSLPNGVPDDIYATIIARAAGAGGQIVLDTSGAELRQALSQGGAFLVKPSRGELEQLAGRALPAQEDMIAEARRLVSDGRVEQVAVTLGRDGALLVNADGAFALPALPVEARSAVGAGDAFVAGMTYGFASGRDALEAFRFGAAAGAAAVLAPGAGLCFAEDVHRLVGQVPQPQRIA